MTGQSVLDPQRVDRPIEDDPVEVVRVVLRAWQSLLEDGAASSQSLIG